MKRLLLTFLATAAVAGLPAGAWAHPGEDGGYEQDDWDNGGDSFAAFDQEYQHIWNGIQHGLSDGSYTPRQADYFHRAMQNIRARAYWQQQRGYYDGGEIQASLEQLHERMHIAHERGHDRQNEYSGNSGYRYGNPYGYRDGDQRYSFSFGYRQ